MLRQRVVGNRILVRVSVPARGRIRVTGAELRGSSRGVRGAGVYSMTARLTPRAMTALRQKRKLKLTIKVRYVQAAGPSAAATIKLTVGA